MTRKDSYQNKAGRKQARAVAALFVAGVVALPTPPAVAAKPADEFLKRYTEEVEPAIQEGACEAAAKKLDGALATYLQKLNEQPDKGKSEAKSFGLHMMCTSINSIVKDCPCTEAGKRYAAVESRYGLCSEVKVPKPVPECTPGEPLPPTSVGDSTTPSDPTSTDPVPDFKTSVTEQSSESTNPATEPIPEAPNPTAEPTSPATNPTTEPKNPPNIRLQDPTNHKDDSGRRSREPLRGGAITTGVLSLISLGGMGVMAGFARRKDPMNCINTPGSYCRVYETAVAQGNPSGDTDNLCADAVGELKQACNQRNHLIRGVTASGVVAGALAATSVTLAIIYVMRKKRPKEAAYTPSLSVGVGRSVSLGAQWRF